MPRAPGFVIRPSKIKFSVDFASRSFPFSVA
jgi:hypothetical protein